MRIKIFNKNKKPIILLMALYYNKIQKRNMKNPEEGEKMWHPVLRSIKALTENDAAKRIALNSSINPKDALTVIYQLEAFMRETLMQGHSIRLRDFGSFHLTVTTDGVLEKEQVTIDLIKKVNLNFLPSEDFRYALQQAEYVPVETLLSKIKAEGEENP